jgi:hypothetical protein
MKRNDDYKNAFIYVDNSKNNKGDFDDGGKEGGSERYDSCSNNIFK